MKKLTLLLSVIFLSSMAFPQGPTSFKSFVWKNNATYANAQIDTLSALNIGGYSLVSIGFVTNDSVKTDAIYVQHLPAGASTWEVTAGDTISALTTTASAYKEYPIRSSAVDLSPVVGGKTRIIVDFASSANGVTTPTYTVYLFYKP